MAKETRKSTSTTTLEEPMGDGQCICGLQVPDAEVNAMSFFLKHKMVKQVNVKVQTNNLSFKYIFAVHLEVQLLAEGPKRTASNMPHTGYTLLVSGDRITQTPLQGTGATYMTLLHHSVGTVIAKWQSSPLA